MLAWVQQVAEHWLPAFRQRPWWGWGAGLGLFAAAFVLRWLLEGVLPAGLPFVTFFLTVLLATLAGGARVGLTVLALCVAASAFFFIPTYFSFRVGRSDFVALLVFAIFGGGIVAVAHELNVIVERLLAERRRSSALLEQSTRAEERLAQLNGELLHRIRNIFTLATSIAFQTSRHAATPDEMAGALASRFRALAVAQELLVTNDLAGADLEKLAAGTLGPLTPGAGRLTMSGPPLQLTPEAATSISLVLHELATNAVKHGAWSNSRGTVDLAWAVSSRNGAGPLVTLDWQEKNGPPCRQPGKVGLGSVLIDNAVAGASVERKFLPDGLHCSMQFVQGPG
jgi:two-component sensor histidine kinase